MTKAKHNAKLLAYMDGKIPELRQVIVDAMEMDCFAVASSVCSTPKGSYKITLGMERVSDDDDC